MEIPLPDNYKDEVNNFLRGDIERPTEFDKFIPEEINDKNTDEYILAQTAWIAKNSAYIATHLQRWMGEKIVDEIEYGYRVMSNPFTGRVMEIIPACEDMLNVLPSRLPAFQQRFREKYEQLLSVAKKADEEETRRFFTGINSFKLAAMGLNEIVMMIYSESVALVAETRPNAKRIIAAIFISFVMILLFELFVYFGPFTWLKDHPNSYGLQGGIIFMISSVLVGLFVPQWRKWCWGVAGLAFLMLILSLLGGRPKT